MKQRATSWCGRWRIAIRLALRDLLAHRRRSALVVTMILVPVALMVFVMGAIATSEVTVAEDPDAVIGSAAASVSYAGDYSLTQTPDGTVVEVCGGQLRLASAGQSWMAEAADYRPPGCAPAATIRGMRLTGDPLSPARAVAPLEQLLGARVFLTRTQRFALGSEYGFRQADVLFIDAGNDVFRGMADLRTGRWPRAPGEAVVTQAGLDAGLPGSGQVGSSLLSAALSVGDVTIVGVADSPKAPGASPLLVMPADSAIETGQAQAGTLDTGLDVSTSYLVAASSPVTWDQVRALNRYGLVVVSRQVLADPPAGVSARFDALGAGQLRDGGQIDLTALTAALLAMSCLIAGPAFSVMATRQRRMLALVAACGGDRGQLRRTVLAQAGLLGVSAVTGGTLLGAGAVAVLAAAGPGWLGISLGPYEMPLVPVLTIAAVGVLACLVAALVPARRLGGTGIARALAGDDVAAAGWRYRPLLAVLLSTAGAVACVLAWILPAWWEAGSQWPELTGWTSAPAIVPLVIGLGALIVGALLAVPGLLAAAGRHATALPLPARLAVREASRLRGRSAAAIAAFMAGGMLLSGVAVPVTSAEAARRSAYAGSAPHGQLALPLTGGAERTELARLASRIEQSDPGLRVRRLDAITGRSRAARAGAARTVSPAVGLVLSGCDVRARAAQSWTSSGPPCLLGSAPRADAAYLASATVEDAIALFGLGEQAQGTLRDGGVVLVSEQSAARTLSPDGRVRILAGDTVASPEGAGSAGQVRWLAAPQVTSLPATSVPGRSFDLSSGAVVAVITPQTVAALGLTSAQPNLLVGVADDHQAGRIAAMAQVPAGAGVTDQQADAISRLTGAASPLAVERGYHAELTAILGVLGVLAGLLMVVATLTSTVLTAGESRRDLATMTAVGAAPGLRRWYAAIQAGGLAWLGTLIGLGIGAIPAVTAALDQTATDAGGLPGAAPPGTAAYVLSQLARLSSGSVDIPWLLFVVALIVVPLLAAGCAALFAGREPDPVRRAR